jgi:uncharacterized integral membrane protein (TIGR00697 family)
VSGFGVGTAREFAQPPRRGSCAGTSASSKRIDRLLRAAHDFPFRNALPNDETMKETASAKVAFAPYDTANQAPPVNAPRGLFVFLILYGGMTVLAGVVAYKQVQLWPSPLSVEAGIFPFLLLVVISSTISQLYGRAMATRLVWWGFVPLALSAALIFLVLVLPPAPDMLTKADRLKDLAAFERVLGQTPRILIAGPAAYITSLLLNIWIFDRLRGSGDATTFGLMVRGAIASALSQALDSVIFITLAFYGRFDITSLMIGQVLAKVTLSLVLVPFLITFGVRFATWLDSRHAMTAQDES